jgi:hypothetical protein
MIQAFSRALMAALVLTGSVVKAGPTPIRPRLPRFLVQPVTAPTFIPSTLHSLSPIIAFRATRNGSRVLLQWRTTGQQRAFVVQRALDGIYWLDLAHLTVDSVVSTKTRKLDFEEEWTSGGFYRVAQACAAYQGSYSPVVWVAAVNPRTILTARQLPSSDIVLVQGADLSQQLQLISVSGYFVREVTAPAFSCADLLAGVYALRQGKRITRLVVR